MASSGTLTEDSTHLLAPSDGIENVAPPKVANEDMQVEQHQAKPTQHVQAGSAVNSESNGAIDVAPEKPKRPKSAYFIFMNEVRSEITFFLFSHSDDIRLIVYRRLLGYILLRVVYC